MAMMNGLRKLDGWLRAVRGKILLVMVLAALTASCMSVPIPQDNFVGKAVVDKRDVKAEFDTRYPAGTPVEKLVNDMKALGATCAAQSSSDVVTCRHAIVLESYMILPALIPLADEEGYAFHVDVHSRNGMIERVDFSRDHYPIHMSWPFYWPLLLLFGE